jgi:hypothetical protein
MLSHPPYSPDLSSADLFPKLKIAMKETRFKTVSSIQQTVTRELKATGEKRFFLGMYVCTYKGWAIQSSPLINPLLILHFK